MRPFFLRIFFRERDWNAAVNKEAEDIVRKRIAARIRLYASNPTLLRAAAAGYHGVRPEHLPDAPRTLDMIERAIRAFGDELGAMDAAAITRPEPISAGVMELALGDEAEGARA